MPIAVVDHIAPIVVRKQIQFGVSGGAFPVGGTRSRPPYAINPFVHSFGRFGVFRDKGGHVPVRMDISWRLRPERIDERIAVRCLVLPKRGEIMPLRPARPEP